MNDKQQVENLLRQLAKKDIESVVEYGSIRARLAAWKENTKDAEDWANDIIFDMEVCEDWIKFYQLDIGFQNLTEKETEHMEEDTEHVIKLAMECIDRSL